MNQEELKNDIEKIFLREDLVSWEDIHALLTKNLQGWYGTYSLVNYVGSITLDGSNEDILKRQWIFELRCRSFGKWKKWATIKIDTEKKLNHLDNSLAVKKVKVK